MATRKRGTPYDLGSIDPGNEEQARRCYVAYWRDSELRALELLNHLDFAKGYGSGCLEVALETPIIYERGDDPSPPNVIVQVNVSGCLLAGAMAGGNVFVYSPKKWKGNAAKPPHHLSIWEALTPKERMLFPQEIVNGKLRHTVPEYIERGIELNAPRYYKKPLRSYSAAVTNYLDAAGIGLVHLGRMPRP